MEFLTPLLSSCAPRRLSFCIFVRPTLGHRSSLPVSGASNDESRHKSSKRRDSLMRANLLAEGW